MNGFRFICLSLVSLGIGLPCSGYLNPIEIHDQIVVSHGTSPLIALTLDACSGKYDARLIEFLIGQHIPATIFVTKRWIDRNPVGVSVIKANLDLFEVEDHGENHIPAIIGAGRRVYGIAGVPDLNHLRREVTEGARAIHETIGVTPRWYRGATAEYDQEAITEIERLGYKIAGFSINADDGATLNQWRIEKRLQRVRAGDIIIAHMNKPTSDSANGLMAGLRKLLGGGFIFVRLDRAKVSPVPRI